MKHNFDENKNLLFSSFYFTFFLLLFSFSIIKSLRSGSISYYIHLFIESKNDRLNFPRKKIILKNEYYNMTTVNTYIHSEPYRRRSFSVWISYTQHTNEKEKSSSLFFVRFFRCCVGIFDGFYMLRVYIRTQSQRWGLILIWVEFFFFPFSVHEFFV